MSRIEDRFCKLRGRFAPTLGEQLFLIAYAACLPGMVVGILLWINHEDPHRMRYMANATLIMLAGLVALGILAFVVVFRRIILIYEFRDQTVLCRRMGGELVWEEPVKSVQWVIYTGGLVPFLTVTWRDRRRQRRVFLCRALRRALRQTTAETPTSSWGGS